MSAAADIPADCHGDGNPDLDGDGQDDDNDVLVQQRIYEDADGNGIFARGVDTEFTSAVVGCRYYHPEHDHYHVQAFAEYSLQNVVTGDVARTGGKINFCVADTDPFDLSLPGAPQPGGEGRYSAGTCNARLSTQGLSVGWSDRYGWRLQGQEIDITGMPAGDYCLIAEADPQDRVDETDEANNENRRQLHIDPTLAPSEDYIELPSVANCDVQEPPPSTYILRPDSTVASGWRVVGAKSAWAALDDTLVPPAAAGPADFIRSKERGQRSEIGFGSPPVSGIVPHEVAALFYARTRSDTRLRARVRWGGTTRETYTLGRDRPFGWRRIPISPPPSEKTLSGLSLRFRSLDGGHATVRAAFLEVTVP